MENISVNVTTMIEVLKSGMRADKTISRKAGEELLKGLNELATFVASNMEGGAPIAEKKVVGYVYDGNFYEPNEKDNLIEALLCDCRIDEFDDWCDGLDRDDLIDNTRDSLENEYEGYILEEFDYLCERGPIRKIIA